MYKSCVPSVLRGSEFCANKETKSFVDFIQCCFLGQEGSKGKKKVKVGWYRNIRCFRFIA